MSQPIPLPIEITDYAGTPLALEGEPRVRLHTFAGTHIATGYQRIVVGGRGAYIELSAEQINHAAFQIPANAEWRLTNPNAYYTEYRSDDAACVKLYHQRRLVDYADYRIGMYYLAPGAVLIQTPRA